MFKNEKQEYGRRMYNAGIEAGDIRYLKLANRLEKRAAKREKRSEKLEEKRDRIYNDTIERLQHSEKLIEAQRKKILADAREEANNMVEAAREKLQTARKILIEANSIKSNIDEEFRRQRKIQIDSEQYYREGTVTENKIYRQERQLEN